jgi:hypothetical protein
VIVNASLSWESHTVPGRAYRKTEKDHLDSNRRTSDSDTTDGIDGCLSTSSLALTLSDQNPAFNHSAQN